MTSRVFAALMLSLAVWLALAATSDFIRLAFAFGIGVGVGVPSNLVAGLLGGLGLSVPVMAVVWVAAAIYVGLTLSAVVTAWGAWTTRSRDEARLATFRAASMATVALSGWTSIAGLTRAWPM